MKVIVGRRPLMAKLGKILPIALRPKVPTIGVECVVFSRDRALQLYALMSTYREKVRSGGPVHLLFRASSTTHRAAYLEVVAAFRASFESVVEEERQGEFRRGLIRILRALRSDKVIFLVDDDLFVEQVDLQDFANADTRSVIPSLRLGLNLERCYTHDVDQPVPELVEDVVDEKDKICWRWKDGEYDWGYPLSLDGHLFSVAEMLKMVSELEFSSPNTLEAALSQNHGEHYRNRFGIAYRKAKLVNVPCNKVQTDYENRSGNVSAEFLLNMWQRGYELDYRKFFGWCNRAAHEELPLEFTPRHGPPVSVNASSAGAGPR